MQIRNPGQTSYYRPLSSEDEAIFALATAGITGGYKPFAVATQVINGMMRVYLCDVTVTTQDLPHYPALVYVAQTIDGTVRMEKVVKLVPGTENSMYGPGGSYRVINILATVDADAILKNNLSVDKDKPTAISSGVRLLVSGASEMRSQAEKDVTFKANTGDKLQILGTTGSHNFDDMVMLYEVKRNPEDTTLNKFVPASFERNVPMPGSENDILPAKNKIEKHLCFNSSFKELSTTAKTVPCTLCFALYTRNGSKNNLKGYFCTTHNLTIYE